MKRYRLAIEYDGSGFVGWQRQKDGASVQAAIEAAVFAFTGEEAAVYGAGRTDAGVHATGQVAHLDLEKPWPVHTIRDALNAHLRSAGARVAILEATEAASGFDARFSAIRRRYLYRIFSRRVPLVLERDRAWWVPVPLDPQRMHEAAQILVGHHDFTTFRSTQCQAKSPLRTLESLDVSVNPHDGAIEIRAVAQSFLHNQIRSFAGTLKWVGDGRWTEEDVARALAARDRKACGPVAPPEGLYFQAVEYGDEAIGKNSPHD